MTKPKQIQWDCTRNTRMLAEKIAARAAMLLTKGQKETIKFSQTDTEMDILATHLNGCPLNLKGLLEAKPFDFFHDVMGIRNHLCRTTGQLQGCFLPRYALKEGA